MRVSRLETRGARARRAGVATAIAALMGTTGPFVAAGQSPASSKVQYGVSLFESGDYAAAKATLSSSAREGNGAEVAFYLGRIAVIEDRPEEAVAFFERAIKADGGRTDYHLWLGIALGLQAREAGRFRQAMLAGRARGEFERAVALDPRNVGAREGLVQFYSIAPGIAGGSMRRAREHATEIARVSPMRGHIASGMILEREKNVAGAEREYLAAAAVSPDSAAPYMALGALYQRIARWGAAFEAYQRALALPGAAFPEQLSAHYQFGRTGALSGERLDDSERSLKRWMERAPPGTSPRRVARTRARLGMVYVRQGRNDLARTEFEAALKLNPRDVDAREGLAKLPR
ncbi:MAG: tetratricopeptide repeat protein [Gemmatimonadaceae bacterium]